MTSDAEFTCPNCAETIKLSAKECRFCGQVVNNAVRLGLPEFYSKSSDNLSLEWLMHDYVNHVLPSYGGSMTASNIIGSLLSYGSLDEYEDYKKVKDAMRSREAELAGGELETSPNLPDATPNFWPDTEPERRALYLARRYVENAQDYSKLFGGEDKRQDPRHIEWMKAELSGMIELAETSPTDMSEYVQCFREEIENLDELLGLLAQGKTMNDGKSGRERIEELLAQMDGAASRPAPAPEKKPEIPASENKLGTGAWIIMGLVGFVLFILIF